MRIASIGLRAVFGVAMIIGSGFYVGSARAETISTTFDIMSPSALNFDVQIDTVLVIPVSDSDTASSTLSGTIDVDLEVDFSSGKLEVTDFTITGGSVILNSSLNMSFFGGLATVTGTALAGVPGTPNPPSVLSPHASDLVDGHFDDSDHEVTINQGVITITGSANETIDLSLNPITGASMSATPGDLTVDIFSVDIPTNTTVYDFGLVLPIEFTSVLDSEDPGSTLPADTTITTEVLGVVEALKIDIFVDFLETNGIVGDVNQNGVLFGDGTGLAEVDDVTAFVEGWLSTDLPLGLEGYKKGDLNFDRKTDLTDAFILHEALAANGGGSFDLNLLSGVPEPTSTVLCLLGGVLLLGRRNRIKV